MTEHAPSVHRLAGAVEAVGQQLREWVKAGRELDRIQERAKLIAELVRELQRQLEDAIDAQDAGTIAETLIERARQL